MGTVAACVILRGARRLRNAVDILVMFSYGVPGIVLGIGLIATYHQGPLVLTGTASILILAYIIRRLPFSVRSGVSTLQQLSPETEEASFNLGAGPLRTFAMITVPLLPGAILSGAFLTWSNTVRKPGASLILQSGGNITIAVEIFSQIMNGNFGIASAPGAVLIGLTFIPLLIFKALSGRREALQA
nr:ABC transporter permease subunit [Rhodobacter sp. 24-YEA-8]